MKNLLMFLEEEMKLNEDKNKKSESKVPTGWRKGSTRGRISAEGLSIIRQFLEGEDNDGKTFKYSQRSQVDAERVKSNLALGLTRRSSLGDILGRKGILSPSSAGAKRMQLIFQSCVQSGKVVPGQGGYVMELNPDWTKLAGTVQSSEKIVMFWINTVYNVYKQTGNADAKQLQFYFNGNQMMVDDPSS